MATGVDMRNGRGCLKEFSVCSSFTGFSLCQWRLFLLSWRSCSSSRSSGLGVGEEGQLERGGISWSQCRSGRWCGGRRMLAGWSLWLMVAGQWARLHQPLFNHKENIYNSKDLWLGALESNRKAFSQWSWSRIQMMPSMSKNPREQNCSCSLGLKGWLTLCLYQLQRNRAHACGRERMALSAVCSTTPWQHVKQYDKVWRAGWLYVSRRKHMLAPTVSTE